MAKPTPGELMTLIVERAPALRAAGVRELQIGDFKVLLELPELGAATGASAPAETTELETDDPLNDPMTFGRKTSVPGFERHRDENDDEGAFE